VQVHRPVSVVRRIHHLKPIRRKCMRRFVTTLLLLMSVVVVHAESVHTINGTLSHIEPLYLNTTDNPLGLDMKLKYARDAFGESVMGPYWTHSYDIYLNENSDGTMVFVGGMEQMHFFFLDRDGNYVPRMGDYSKIVHNDDNAWVVTLNDGRVFTFDQMHRLKQITDQHGNKVLVDRSDPEYAKITGPLGKTILVHYRDDQVHWIELPDKSKFVMRYNKEKRLVSYTGPVKGPIVPLFGPTWNFSYCGPKNY